MEIFAIPYNVVNITNEIMFISNASGVGMENFIYKWMHNNTIISEGFGKRSYKITNAKIHHGGYYKCIVNNEYNDTTVSNVIKVIIQSKQQ